MMKSAALLIGLALFSAPPDAHAFPQPADSSHFCVPFDYEQWRRDNPRPAAKRLADLNVGEPRTVRMIYFLPSDRPFRAEVVQRMKAEIRKIQDFYGEQMQANGHGEKTFRYETDDQGEPLVHRVDGRDPDSSYLDDTLRSVLDEIELVFDLEANIYLVVIDNSANRIVDKAAGIIGAGRASRIGKTGGFALITAGFTFRTAAHELGHTFGLEHDFQDQKYIMSYGDLHQAILSPCHAEFLTVHPFFNPAVSIEAGASPVIELLSSPDYPAGSKSVDVRLKLQDPEGLHQVFLLSEALGPGFQVLACRNLAGERDAEVVFEYDGYSPAHADWGWVKILSDKKVHPMRFDAVDLSGNVETMLFQLSEETSPDERRASTIEILAGDHQQGAPGRTLENALVVEVKDQNGDPLPDETIQFGVTEGEARLSGRYLVENATTDANGRAELTLTLGSNPETIVVRVSAPEVPECQPVLFRATAVGVRVASLPGDAETWHLPDHAVARLGKGLIGKGDRAVSFSPDGQRVAVASGIGVWLYDLAASRALALFPTRSPVHSVAFSPDGTRLASGSRSKIDLWDVATGTRSAELIGHSTPRAGDSDVTAVAFSRDGSRLASGSMNQIVKLWDLETGRDIYTWEFELLALDELSSLTHLITLAFTPDDAMLAVGLQDGSVRLLDVTTHEVSATLSGHRLKVRSVVFSRDGRTFASGSDDGAVKLWDVARRETIMTLTGHGGPVTSVSFSRDGKTLASASNDNDVKLWDVGTGTSIATFSGGHTSWATSVSFSPEGTTVASGSSEDGSVILWDVATGNAAVLPGLHVDVGSSVSFSPDGGVLASSSEDGTPKIWDAETGRLLKSFGLRLWGIQTVAFSPDSTTLAAGSSDNTIDLWNVVTGARIASFTRGQGQILSLAFSPDGKMLAAGDPNGIALWDVASVSAANPNLCEVCGNGDGYTATDHYISTPLGYSWVWFLAFSVDGKTIASSSDDGPVTLWDASTLTRLATLGEPSGRRHLAFSPDGTTLATSWSEIELWDVSTRSTIAVLEEGSGPVGFSPDGTLLASGGVVGTVILWDIATLGKIATLEGHTGIVRSLSFSRDGEILASCSGSDYGDGTILLWDLQHLQPRSHTLIKVAGDEQQGPAGAALAHPLVVEVRDQNGDLLPDAPITFTVTAGDGKFSGRFSVEHITTDADGRGEVTLTLGPHPGTNTVEVSIGPRPLATFHAEAVGTEAAVQDGDYRTWHLPVAATARLGKGALGEGARELALSADGRYLAVASGIGVWLYEVTTSRALALFQTEDAVYSVAFSRDGTLAAGMKSGNFELWEVETGERTGTLPHADWGWVTVAFSPDGATLISGQSETIKVWDVETRRLLGTSEGAGDDGSPWPLEVAFSPDGTRLAAGFQDGDGGRLRLWDVATQTEVASFGGRTDPVSTVSFSPDGSLLASAGRSPDLTIKLWDVATQSQVAKLSGHTNGVTAVSFSPDGALLASGSWNDGTVKLWDVGNRTLIRTLEEHTGTVHSVAFSPDGSILVSAASDGTVLLREIETENAAAISGHNFLSAMALSPDGALLASSGGWSDHTVRLWDVSRQSQVAALRGHMQGVSAVSFSPDGGLLASGSWDGTIRLWDAATKSQVAALRGHTQVVSAVSFSPDGGFLASGSREGTIRLWDVGTREQMGLLDRHTDDVLSVSFSPDGAILASAGDYEDQTVKLWNVATQELIATLEGHENAVNTVAFSPNGNTLASGSDYGIRLWDVATRTHIATLEEPGGWNPVNSIAFSPDGTTLVSGSWHGVKVWDLATEQPVSTLEGHTNRIHSVAFAPDGTFVSGSDDGTMLLWDLRPRPHTLIKVAGDKQQGPAGAALARPFVVWVRDQHGNLFAGAAVTFAVTAGDGTLSATTFTTDANGRVESTLTLGSKPGTNTVEVTVDDLEPVVFTATGQAIPQTLAKVSGEGLEGPAGAALSAPFVVSVLDQNGTAFAGATVTFAVTAGGGTLSTTTATTDAEGRAAVTLTLGSAPGAHTVEATVAGLEPVTFTAVAEASPDFDGDGETGFSDFFLFAEAFGGSDPRFDLDGDGSVGFGDFFLLSDHFADPARGKLLALARERIGLPNGPNLRQNAPNPFNSETVISWFLLRPGPARVEVFSLTGQRVAVLHQGLGKAGVHRVNWNGRDGAGRPLASGVYLYRLVTDERVHTRKLTLLR